jgi:hypothetical protein
MGKRTWKVAIRLEERGEASYSSENLGATELAIPGDFPTAKIGQIVQAHADAILSTAAATRPDPVVAESEA